MYNRTTKSLALNTSAIHFRKRQFINPTIIIRWTMPNFNWSALWQTINLLTRSSDMSENIDLHISTHRPQENTGSHLNRLKQLISDQAWFGNAPDHDNVLVCSTAAVQQSTHGPPDWLESWEECINFCWERIRHLQQLITHLLSIIFDGLARS